jgi:hypothetical protein
MGILIVTQPGDTHAHAVQWALQLLGHNCSRWFPGALAERPVSIRLNDRRVMAELAGPEGMIDFESIHGVWLRRFELPPALQVNGPTPEYMTETDKIVARGESDSFLRGINYIIGKRAYWINRPNAQRAATYKAAQLTAARKVGLRIPNTLMTNDIEQARAFIQSSNGRVIYKPFFAAFWQRENLGDEVGTFTVPISESDLVDPNSLRLSPGIFQQFVSKKYELRIFVFGRNYVAAQITDQDDIDWRISHRMKLSPCRLSSEIELKLMQFMDEMGLVTGSVDMIVTSEGEHFFLEINEQGQFLWLEQMNEEIRVLGPFARFLASYDKEVPLQQDKDISLGDYFASPSCSEFIENELKKTSMAHLVLLDKEGIENDSAAGLA